MGEWLVVDNAKSLKVKWPVGPHYTKWVKGKSAHAWVEYKLKSAEWFLKTLVRTSKVLGRLDRNAGVEMAIDGVLNSLCAAFDASISLLVRALEIANGFDGPDRAPIEQATWDRAATLASAAALRLSSAVAVVDALSGTGSPEPDGWLAQLQALRDLSVVENRLVPHWDLGHGNPRSFMDVPGVGLQEPITYLRAALEAVRGLVTVVLVDVDTVSAKGRLARQRRGMRPPARSLPDLATRARLVPPRRGTGE